MKAIFAFTLFACISLFAGPPQPPLAFSPGTTNLPAVTLPTTSTTFFWGFPKGATYTVLEITDFYLNRVTYNAVTASGLSVGFPGGRTFGWRVAAGNDAGLSEYSLMTYFTTPGSRPAGVNYYGSVGQAVANIATSNYKFVIRTVGVLSNQLTASEAQQIKASGLQIVLFCEPNTPRVLDGFQAGVVDATLAASQALAAGAPANFFCYFAVELDFDPENLPAIYAYLDGVASVLGSVDRVGIYSDYLTVKTVLDAKKAGKAWQGFFWKTSDQFDPRVSIVQGQTSISVAGQTCHFNASYATNYGQWITPATGTGGIRVSLASPRAVAAGAQWRVDGGAFLNSNTSATGLPTGAHVVSFKALPGWDSPPNQTISVGTVTTLTTAIYAATPPVITNLVLQGGSRQMALFGTPNFTYTIESATDLNNWTPVSTNNVPAAGVADIAIQADPAQPAGFLRAVSQP
jgi:hypothetical protein